MTEVFINDAFEREATSDDVGAETLGQYYYVLQYDMPGVEVPEGLSSQERHYHVIPMDAIANIMMDSGMSEPLDALEYAVQDRVHTVVTEQEKDQLVTKDVDNVRPRVQEIQSAQKMLHENVLQTAREMPLDSMESMMEKIFRGATPGQSQRLSGGEPNIAATIKASVSNVVVNKKAPGWNRVQTLVMNRGNKLLESQRRMFMQRFGNELLHIIKTRINEEKRA